MDKKYKLEAINNSTFAIYRKGENGSWVSIAGGSEGFFLQQIVKEGNAFDGLLKAVKVMQDYFVMLEKATGVEHECLKQSRVAVAQAEKRE